MKRWCGAVTMMACMLPGVVFADIYFVNIKKIAEAMNVEADIKKTIDAKYKSQMTALKAEEKSLQTESDQISKDRTILAKADLDKKTAAFQQKAISYTQKAQDLQQKVMAIQTSHLNKMKVDLDKIFAEIADAKTGWFSNVTGFMDISQAVYVVPRFDITDRVIDKIKKG